MYMKYNYKAIFIIYFRTRVLKVETIPDVKNLYVTDVLKYLSADEKPFLNFCANKDKVLKTYILVLYHTPVKKQRYIS